MTPSHPKYDKIKHFVILTMENRSFDHFFGALALPPHSLGVDGLTNPPRSLQNLAGNDIANWAMDGESWNFPALPHGLADFAADFNNGKNDGFIKTYEKANGATPELNLSIPMGYYTEKTLPVLYSLAKEFSVCDRWFASMLSSTWPNRKYLHSGKCDLDLDTQIVPGLWGFQTTPMYGELEKHGITWRCYFSDVPFLAGWYWFAASHALSNFSRIDQFVAHCREDSLPSVSIIDPPFTLADDHPPHDPRLGEKFIGLVVDALTNSPSWKSTALIILYDEGGGFYDHVPPPGPPEEGFGATTVPLGFRVPAIVVSPYSKRGVLSTPLDHTSIMRTFAETWGIDFPVDTFGTRWKHANSLWDAFDFQSEPRGMGVYTETFPREFASIASLNWGNNVRERLATPMGEFETALERIFVLPELKGLDNRPAAFHALGQLEHDVITLKRLASYHTATPPAGTPV